MGVALSVGGDVGSEVRSGVGSGEDVGCCGEGVPGVNSAGALREDVGVGEAVAVTLGGVVASDAGAVSIAAATGSTITPSAPATASALRIRRIHSSPSTRSQLPQSFVLPYRMLPPVEMLGSTCAA